MPETAPRTPAEMRPRHLYLIDGSGYIFRAYHALRERARLTRSDGTPIGAVLVFCNMLYNLLRDTDCDALAVVFDAARKTFRNDLDARYKANRAAPPEDLVPQFPLIREATAAFGLPVVEVEGYEADDLIATYARLARERGERVTIVTSDKDLMQLVGDGVDLFEPVSLRRIGAAEVAERFGVGPEKVVEVQALVGDAIDNVPGVPGLTVDAAGALITAYGGLDNLLAAAENPERLVADAARRLTGIERDVHRLAGRSFPIGSPKELGTVLADELGLAGVRDQATGKYATGAEVLKRLAAQGHVIAALVLQWRALGRVRSYAHALSASLERVRLNRELVRLREDAPVPQGLDAFTLRRPDPGRLRRFLEAQEFHKLLVRVEADRALLPASEAAAAEGK